MRTNYSNDKKKTAVVMLCFACAVCAVSLVFFGLHIARMRHFELDCTRTYGTLVEFKYFQSSGRGSYRCIFEYTYEGKTYRATDRDSYKAPRESAIGEKLEIYVDPAAPQNAERVKTADVFSIVAAATFVISLPAFSAGLCCVVAMRRGGYLKRLAFVWLPQILLCVTLILLFATGLPFGGVSEIFARTRGAIGYTVGAALVALCAVVDGVIAHINKRGNSIKIKFHH